jgi:hypothetical protein
MKTLCLVFTFTVAAGAQDVLNQSYQRRQESADKLQKKMEAAMGGTPAATGQERGAAPSSNNTFFVTWRDPRENAFEVGVPKGWSVTGGLIRHNAVDAGGTVQVQSPDGKIQIFIGDPDLQAYQTPSQTTQMMGLREGQATTTGSGGKVVILRYLSGSQFAQQYIRSRMCGQAAFTDAAELRELSAQMNSILQAYAQRFGGQFASEASAGEAAYQCGSGSGYLQTTTLWVRSTGPAGNAGAMWWVWRMGGYQVSDPQQSGLAYYVLNTMLETFKFDPQWEARNEQSVDAATKAIMKAQDDIAKSAAQFAQGQASKASAGGYNHPNTGQLPQDLRKKWATEYNSLQKRGDAVSGQAWVHTANGQNVRVSNSATNWWHNAAGDVVPGPESGSPPSGGGWEKLSPGWQ